MKKILAFFHPKAYFCAVNQLKHNMKNEINNVVKMITSKVANLTAQGMDEQAAFNAVMERMENEHSEVFALLINVACA